MQSLALDVNVVSEEGARTEMRDEDDDLLRAAEELGIDLSGVRARPTATRRPPTRPWTARTHRCGADDERRATSDDVAAPTWTPTSTSTTQTLRQTEAPTQKETA